MGICTSTAKVPKNSRKCHCVLYEQKNDCQLLDLRSGTRDFEIDDFLLTTSGYLILGNKPDHSGRNFYWTKKFKRNSLTMNMAIFKMELTRGEGNSQNNFIENISFGNAENQRFWEVLNSLENDEELVSRGIEIKDKDIIRFGKQVVRVTLSTVKQLEQKEDNVKHSHKGHNKNKFNEVNSMGNMINKNSLSNRQDHIDESNDHFKSSNICWSCQKTQTPDNLFHDFCPCAQPNPCHLSCLRNWLMARIKTCSVNSLEFYNFASVVCEYCEQPYRAFSQINNVRTLIVDPKLPATCPYAIFEIYHPDDHKILKGLVVVNMTGDKEITIGRSSKNDIVFKEESVSQKHASIQIFNKQLFMTDQKSRHGTFRLVKNPLKFNETSNKLYSIGRWLIEFHAFKGNVCGCEEEVTAIPVSNKNPYQDYTHLLISDINIKSPTIQSDSSSLNMKSNLAQVSLSSERHRQVRFEGPIVSKPPTEYSSQIHSKSPGKENYHIRDKEAIIELPKRLPTDLFDLTPVNRHKVQTTSSLQRIPSETNNRHIQNNKNVKYQEISEEEDEDDFIDSPSTLQAPRQRRSTLFKSILKANEYRQSLFIMQPQPDEAGDEEEAESEHKKKELKRFMTDLIDEIAF